MKRYNFFLPEPVVEQLKEIANEKGTTTSALIRQVLIKYVKIQNERRNQSN
jgi:metal-responsive CopG/Arc/MetJ family transcriptional regulator